MRDETLVIRADASLEVGAGHVMRALAVANAWQDAGGRCRLLSRPLPPALVERMRQADVSLDVLPASPGGLEDAHATVAALRESDARWVCADGYHLDAAWQRAVVDGGARLLFFDDNGHCERYAAHLVLNQNAHAHSIDYAPRHPRTRVLRGPKFAQLRREFLQHRGRPARQPDVARRVLVAFGGSDPRSMVLRLLRAWLRRGPPNVVVTAVTGALNPDTAAIMRLVEGSRGRLRALPFVHDMPSLIAASDLAISAAGSTTYELASMGVPTVLVTVAVNQILGAREMHRLGAAVLAGDGAGLDFDALVQTAGGLLSDLQRRQTLSERARSVVDGRGGLRLMRAMRHAST